MSQDGVDDDDNDYEDETEDDDFDENDDDEEERYIFNSVDRVLIRDSCSTAAPPFFLFYPVLLPENRKMSFPRMMTNSEMTKKVTRVPLMTRRGKVTTVAYV